jgi:hypothetical protein
VYTADLEVEVIRRLLEVFIMKFADDTKGAKVIESVMDRDKLQQALDCLGEWADKWGMEFNIAKCMSAETTGNMTTPCEERGSGRLMKKKALV